MKKFVFRFAFLITPFIIGTIGYLPFYKNDLLWAMYSALRLYSLNLDVTFPSDSLWLEAARWLAPIAVTGFILSFLNTIRNQLKKWYVSLIPRGMVFYGASDTVQRLYNQRRKDSYWVINKQFSKAKNQVIMLGNDEDNIQFLVEKSDLMAHSNVYIQLDQSMYDLISSQNVHCFDLSENIARVYWRDNPVRTSEKIAIVGFGRVGQALLTVALKTNVIAVEQLFEYHVFGDFSKFKAMHTGIEAIEQDVVVYHLEKWFQCIELLKTMDRIILTGDENDVLEQLIEMIHTVGYRSYSVRVDQALALKAIARKFDERLANAKVVAFGTQDQICTHEIIFNESLYKKAKAIHSYYQAHYGGKGWGEIDGFDKYSNVASADHIETKLWLKKKGLSLEAISEIEHMRWCRYYYLNNWSYGIEKDKLNRTHPSLKPYAALDEPEKDKDRELCRLVLSEEF